MQTPHMLPVSHSTQRAPLTGGGEAMEGGVQAGDILRMC